MARRYVERSRVDDLGNIIPEVIAVVSAKNNLQAVDNSQQYFKRNYLDALKHIIPNLYFSDEEMFSGAHISFTNQLINSHITANKHQQTILPVSSIELDPELSEFNTPQGLAKFFYKDQRPAQIDTDDFERSILSPLGKKFSDFSTSTAFVDYVSGTLLPIIPMVYLGHHDGDDLAALTSGVFGSTAKLTYKYLVENLGWVYLLNRSGPSRSSNGLDPFDPSSSIPLLLAETLWKGRPLVLEDTLGLYQEYLWKNQPIWEITDNIIPVDYTSSMERSEGTWTSGTQSLDKLKTLVSIVYSPQYLNSPDRKVETSFQNYFNTSTVSQDGVYIEETEEAGPLTRFMGAVGFAMADRVSEMNEINTLYDIGKAPSEFLELLGELIGWDLFGADIDKWRVQLRNAVSIYKKKGTRQSIQLLLNLLFGNNIDVTTSDTMSELWESYVPDLIYYSLATSSPVFKNFSTYSKDQAKKFGINYYSNQSMETNIKYVVDRILFDLMREFPQSFFLGGQPFPVPQLLLNGEPYFGPYNIDLENTDFNGIPGFWTGITREEFSDPLVLDYELLFSYRNRTFFIPPYEKKQYYTGTYLTAAIIERIENYLKFYGVNSVFAKQVADYIRENSNSKTTPESCLNSFLFFTTDKKYAPNYDTILEEYAQDRVIDPVSLLPLWNGKSSHFVINLNASSFDFASAELSYTTNYALNRIGGAVRAFSPAHSIPEIFLTISGISDDAGALDDNSCFTIKPKYWDVYEGSSTVTTGFTTCAINMANVAGVTPNRFKRGEVDSVADSLLSSTGYLAKGAANRNSIRRRNYKHLLPEGAFFTRNGRNNPGSLELSTPFYSSSTGYVPLGFIPSSLVFKEIPLVTNPTGNGIGQLLNSSGMHYVWEICSNLQSPDSAFGYDISNTFASRAKQNITSSDCDTYGKRGELNKIIWVMNKIHDEEKYLLASSIVSGYVDTSGNIDETWPSSSPLISPTDLSSWYTEANGKLGVVKSIGNYLINQEAYDDSLYYYENFKFGRGLRRLYKSYITDFSGHGINHSSENQGGPNIFSHAYGPLIYNSTFEIDGSALEASGYLAASSADTEVDISYFGGSGLLSPSGMNNMGSYDLGTVAASTAATLPIGATEFRNADIVSGIELVDTSSSIAFSGNPIFSVLRLSRNEQSKYSPVEYLVNNQIVKYHRSTRDDLFPRLRVPIKNSDVTNLARNFLTPNHTYEVTVKAHNLDVSSNSIGGELLGMWVHTTPVNDSVWSYNNGVWRSIAVSDLSGGGSFSITTAEKEASYIKFKEGSFETIDINSGFDGGNTPQSYTAPSDSILQGTNPETINNLGNKSLQEFTFTFNTNNQLPYNSIHSKDQEYVINIFTKGHPTKFVVFEEVSIQDVTLYNKAVVETDYGNIPLEVDDTKEVFRFFKDLSRNIASRSAVATSSVMELSGGSRINYRSNIPMFPNDYDSTFNQLSSIDINEG